MAPVSSQLQPIDTCLLQMKWLLRVFFSFWDIEVFCNLGVPGKTDFDNLKFCCWHFLISLVSVKVFLNFHFLFLISLVLSYSLSKVFSLSLFFSGLITPLPLSVKGFITFNFCFLFHHSCPTLCKRFPHSHFLFLFHHQRVPSCWHICKINVGTVYNGCVKMYSSLCATSV